MRRVVWIASAAVVAAVAVWFGVRALRQPDCSGAPEVEPFDARRWEACSGPHRIAIARSLVAAHALVGRSVADATAQLGPLETERDGERGWSLGEPDGASSLYPNDPFLEIELAGGRITAAQVIDAGR